MASQWKLVRLGPFIKEYALSDSNIISVGRGMENDITCHSIFVSRRHCVLIVEDDGLVYVKDLKSSNGTFIGTKKISPEEKCHVNVNEEIGLGVTMGKLDVQNEEDRFIFQLVSTVKLEVVKCEPEKSLPCLKRKANDSSTSVRDKHLSYQHSDSILSLQFIEPEVIDLVSDDDSESDIIFNPIPSSAKKLKLDYDKSAESAAMLASCSSENLKVEQDDSDSGVDNTELPFDIMRVKDELRDDLDDPIYADSDSDSDMWMMRLSQSSPGKPFMKVEPARKEKICSEINECVAPISLLESISRKETSLSTSQLHGFSPCVARVASRENSPDIERELFFLHEGVPNQVETAEVNPVDSHQPPREKGRIRKKIDMLLDVLDGCNVLPENEIKAMDSKKQSPTLLAQPQRKLIFMEEDIFTKKNKKSNDKQKNIVDKKLKSSHIKFPKERKRRRSHDSSRRSSTGNYKEERKRKLKEIAQKHITDIENQSDTHSKVVIKKVNAKVTSSNRGEFLTTSAPKPRSRSSSHPIQSTKVVKVHERSNTNEVLIESNARSPKLELSKAKDPLNPSMEKMEIMSNILSGQIAKISGSEDRIFKCNSTSTMISSEKTTKEGHSKLSNSGKDIKIDTREKTRSKEFRSKTFSSNSRSTSLDKSKDDVKSVSKKKKSTNKIEYMSNILSGHTVKIPGSEDSSLKSKSTASMVPYEKPTKEDHSKSSSSEKRLKNNTRARTSSKESSITKDAKTKTTVKGESRSNISQHPRGITVSNDPITSSVKEDSRSRTVSRDCNETSVSNDPIESSVQKDPRIPSIKNQSNKNTTKTDPNKDKNKSSSISSKKSCIKTIEVMKHKKRVTFSTSEPKVLIFDIEPGNKLKSTSLCKLSLYNLQQVFSLEQKFLMKILHWSPKWLEEQLKTKDPPPILTNNRQPEQLRHSFVAHQQYVSIVGDLLLMEIWEYVTQTYLKKKISPSFLNLVLECAPPNPGEKSNGFVSMSVNLSLPKVEGKLVPRFGELMKINIGLPQENNCIFAFVQNVRSLPAPIHNKNVFFSITLNVLFSEIMERMRPGETLLGTSLSFIKNELMLVQAIEELRGSPLQDVILNPNQQHFARNRMDPANIKPTPWTMHLNSSQKEAVETTVQAAFGDQPLLQMIQGPPGTGKSSVICSMVLRYFYNNESRKCKDRHKLLICATSNAAVDEIVLRLLNLRQNFPKEERLRMVRVGRMESMHPRAAAISSQSLAKNFVTQAQTGTVQTEEMSYLQSKVNSWRVGAESATEPARAAYCAERMRHFAERLSRAQEGLPSRARGSPDGLLAAETRVLEGADIVVTTLASCANMKLKCLKGQIALCIIDEAGQAIEPETLIPLMLAVTKIALVGDPQQLPGYICSQRAKQYGLSESLFSRISQCAEEWPKNPVILLNQQYRMHPAISHFPNKAFYNGQLQDSPTLRHDFLVPPYRLLYISSGDKGQGVNEMEAWGVSRLVFELACQAQEMNMSIGVITPYNAHKDMIRGCLKHLHEGSPPPLIEVNTIDSFQGQERDIVVVSLARSQGLGFLADPGRMTVALTRAKHCLVICLNPQAMMNNGLWRTLIDDGNKRNVSKYLPSPFCQPATPQQAAHQNVLQYLK